MILRLRIGRSELVRSLSTNTIASARMRADLLYRHSEGLFAAATMLSSDEIAGLVKEFYQLTLTIDDHRRLFPEQQWSEENHRARSEYLDQSLTEQRNALRKDDFEKANPAAQVVMARRNSSEADLGPGEYNQIRQAILRASIDIIGELRARQDGDFNQDPRDKLLIDALRGAPLAQPSPSQSAALAAQPSRTLARGGPDFSEIAEAFRSDQVVTKIWDQQTAGQARASYRLVERYALADERVARLHSKVHLEIDAEVDGLYPKQWIGKVSVTTVGGRKLTARVDEPKGDPSNTLAKQELEAKAIRLAEFRGGATADEMRACISQMWCLDQLDRAADLLAKL